MLFRILIISFTQLLILISSSSSSDHLPYDYVFGWSNGHVGSTSLSSAATYANPKNITFTFEKYPRPKSAWRNHGKDKEFEFARKYLQRLDLLRKNQTLVDLGHHNMYFIYGILQVMLESPQEYRILFVRIRRHRYSILILLKLKY